MAVTHQLPAPQTHSPERAALVPRFGKQGYDAESLTARRRWIEGKTGVSLPHIGSHSISGEQMRGNIENPVGAAQVPLGLAGPLLIHGGHARGVFYVPLATTEGALVRSLERGMTTLTRAGGVTVRIVRDENRISPVFVFFDVAAACDFALRLPEDFEAIRQEAESTTSHGKLLRIECQPLGREVIVHFCYHTADAHGMNMIAKATDLACQWIMRHSHALGFQLFSGACSEKKGGSSLFSAGKGKKAIAGALLSASLLKNYLHVSPAELAEMWHHTVLGHTQAGVMGCNGHYANGLAALFIACGQDVANIVNSAVGMTNFELTKNNEVYVSVTLPSLTVATVGGGTGQGTARECLRLLGVSGKSGALKLAEITAATLLAGEISMGAAIADGEFVAAHEQYGRNRPPAQGR